VIEQGEDENSDTPIAQHPPLQRQSADETHLLDTEQLARCTPFTPKRRPDFISFVFNAETLKRAEKLDSICHNGIIGRKNDSFSSRPPAYIRPVLAG
jgi:hypothetical protein